MKLVSKVGLKKRNTNLGLKKTVPFGSLGNVDLIAGQVTFKALKFTSPLVRGLGKSSSN